MTVAILGAGWVGAALGRALAARGDTVHAATTTPEKLEELRTAGMHPFLLSVTPDGIVGDGAAAFFEADALVVTIPPGRRGPNGVEHYPARIGHVVRAALGHAATARTRPDGKRAVPHLVFTSSTSVYPDLESAPMLAEEAADLEHGQRLRQSGAACLLAERRLTEVAAHHAPQAVTTVLRLAGLFGPGRTPARYLAGRTDIQGGDRPVNLVHRDDVVAALLRVLDTEPGGTFNLVADAHPARRAFYPAAAVALGLEPPTFVPSDGAVVGKRVSNARAKAKLGLTFRTLDPARHAEETAPETAS
ncbi:MAG: NAD-dependent epimerase/dehydratase family protein [Bacteroidota bacterium]